MIAATLGGVVSNILGVVYTLAWSISFYPQLILNYQRQSVTGLSIDFLYLNPLGFACYTTFNAVLLFSPTVKHEYRSRHSGHNPNVRWNDLAFSLHALIISSLTVVQSIFYKRDSTQSLSIFNRFFFSLSLLAILLSVVLASSAKIQWLDLIYFLSYVKLYISFAKYVPQAWKNYRRKSTEGWSIENILLDATGGILSLAQLILDSALSNDWKSITGNPGKLGLSLLSIAFDLLFITQHYVLYRHSGTTLLHPVSEREAGPAGEEGETEREGERRPLLGAEA